MVSFFFWQIKRIVPRIGVHQTRFIIKELYFYVQHSRLSRIFQGLDDGTIKAIDKDKLLEKQANRSLDGISALGVDEIFVGGKNCWLNLEC